MKIKEFNEKMEERGIDVCIFLNNDFMRKEPNLMYFSGIDWETACLVFQRKRPTALYVPGMEVERAKRFGLVKNVRPMKRKKLLEQLSKKLKPKTLGLNYSSLSVREFKAIKKYFKKSKIKDVTKICDELRVQKTEEEIDIIKKGCKITDDIIQEMIDGFHEHKFKTESDVERFLAAKTLENGCEYSFPPIVASGGNATLPHYSPQNIKLKKGFCVIDYGLRYNNYCTDITRTVYLGKPSEKEKKLYYFLKDIQEKTIEGIKEGMKCADLYNSALQKLGKYKKYMTHGLGHGIGIEIHEYPNLSLLSKDRIKNGMVFTIEPGIYINCKTGIRIEDDILFDKKPIILTKTSKELEVIK